MEFRKLFPFLAGLAIGVLATGAAADMLGSAVFRDIQPGAYFDAPVGRLYGQGIIKGAAGGNFRPGDFVTRAEVAVMLDRALNGEASANLPPRSASGRSSRIVPVSSANSSSSSSSSISSVATVGAAGAFRFSLEKINFPEAASNVSFTIQRYGGDKGSASVRWATVDGTAKAGVRYNQVSGSVTFADKETTKVISLKFINNLVAESNETFTVILSEPSGGAVIGTPGEVAITVLDNDGSGGSTTTPATAASSIGNVNSGAAGGLFTFSAWSYAVDESKGSVTITVLRKGTITGAANVEYATSAGTASPGVQYTDVKGTLNFAANDATKTFTVQVADNVSIDGNKTVKLKLSNPTGGAALDNPSAIPLTLVDNEANPTASGSVAFNADTYNATEKSGAAVITVVRRANFANTVTVNYGTGDSTATAGTDYTQATGTLTFAPNEASKSFTVSVTKDALVENEERVNLTLSSPSGADLGSLTNALLKISD